MNYVEAGYSKLLYRQSAVNSVRAELPEDVSSQMVPVLTGSSVAGGVTQSASKKIEINWDTGTIIISDGANRRVLIGEDGL